MRNYLRRMEREGVQRVKMFLVITAAYVLFWGPLFFVTLVHHPALGNQLGYEVRHRTIRLLLLPPQENSSDLDTGGARGIKTVRRL